MNKLFNRKSKNKNVLEKDTNAFDNNGELIGSDNKKTSITRKIIRFIFTCFFMLFSSVIVFAMSIQGFLSANLALNSFDDWDSLPKYFMAGLFFFLGWMPFISPLWFYYIYPTTWVIPNYRYLL